MDDQTNDHREEILAKHGAEIAAVRAMYEGPPNDAEVRPSRVLPDWVGAPLPEDEEIGEVVYQEGMTAPASNYPDPEVLAIQRLVDVLESVDNPTRQRLMAWACDRYHIRFV